MAESVISGRRYGGIASPLRWYRDAVTVVSHCRYGGIAMPYHRNVAQLPYEMAFSCRHAPFFASGLRLRQVLNSGNNSLQSAPAKLFAMLHPAHTIQHSPEIIGKYFMQSVNFPKIICTFAIPNVGSFDFFKLGS